MIGVLVLYAYGLLIISGMYMTFFWGRLAIRRIKEMRCDWRYDRYALISSCLTTAAIGTTLFFTARTYGILVWGSWLLFRPGWVPYMLVAGLYILALAKIGFVWAVQMNRHSWVWLSFLGFNALWLIATAIWVWADPVQAAFCGI